MRNDKQVAIILRRQGKSYREIVHATGIPKSTLFEWFHSEEWSLEIKKELNIRNGLRGADALRQHRKDANAELERLKAVGRADAEKEFKKLVRDTLFVAGIMLYWGEGYKPPEKGQIRLANCDANLLRTFLSFLKKTCRVPGKKIKAWVLLYPDLHAKVCLTYWQKNLSMSHEQFIKPTVIQGRHKTSRLTYGVCTVYTGDLMLKTKILEWIRLFAGIV